MTFLILFALVYGTANMYIGYRLYQWLKSFTGLPPAAFGPVFIIIALSPILSRILSRAGISEAKNLSVFGDWWLAIVYWAVLLWLTLDLIRFTDRHLDILPAIARSVPAQGALVILILIGMLVSGAWNAINPVITRYTVEIKKQAEGLDTLKIVLVSDIHMGRIVGSDRVEILAKTINGLSPDVVLFAGDIIDDDAKYVAENNIALPLRLVKSRIGSFAVLGNHEYIGGQPAMAVKLLEDVGLTVLRDTWILIENTFYIVGRDDMSVARYADRGTKPLSEIMAGIDKSKVIFLMDHQPGRINEAASEGVDLQVSGHTHKGQFFPNNLVTSRIYEQDWGYLAKGAYQLIVSCGYGTWGPPVRLGNRPEVVEITVNFR